MDAASPWTCRTKLYEQSVLILPANGDYESPNGSRFVESLLFNLTRMTEEAGGVPPNIEGCGPLIQPFNYTPLVAR